MTNLETNYCKCLNCQKVINLEQTTSYEFEKLEKEIAELQKLFLEELQASRDLANMLSGRQKVMALHRKLVLTWK